MRKFQTIARYGNVFRAPTKHGLWLLGGLCIAACGSEAGNAGSWPGVTDDVTGSDSNTKPGSGLVEGVVDTGSSASATSVGSNSGSAPSESAATSPATSDDSGAVEPDEPTIPVDPTIAHIVPARIRRLSNAEYANSVRALLGTTDAYEALLPADVRQRNFTVNQGQTVSSDWNAEVEKLAKTSAAAVISGGSLSQLSPCTDDTDACATQFIDAFAAKAFRRAVTPMEREGLLTVYRQGATENGFPRGAELVISTVLQAPSFIYLTELGETAADVVTLTDDEIAAELSYVTTKGPPDAELIQAARSGGLSDASVRAQQARRLLATSAGKTALENFVVEWFTADWVLNSSKDNIPEFNQYRPQLYEESRSFVRTILDNHQGDFVTLLTADFTMASSEVASYYGLAGNGQVALAGTPRLGIATQGAFLGGHSSPTHSSPVKRGAAFMRQVLCVDPPDPASVNLVVAAPPPDPSKSTRELFAAHSADAMCQACHRLIDPIGFAFEEFDEGGRVRQGPADNNGHAVDASGSVTLGDTTFTWNNAAEFLQQVASSELAKACVARTATRFGFAWTNSATELAFVEEWEKMDTAQQTQIGEVLIKLITSDLFVQRRSH